MYFIGLIKDEKVWTIGCLLTIKEALQVVQDNSNYLGMLDYSYLVIEQIGLGIHPKVKNSWFFKWDNILGFLNLLNLKKLLILLLNK